MKFSAILFAAAAQTATAHYIFDTSIVNGSPVNPPFKYIRDVTRQTKYNPIKFSSNPAADIRDGSFADGPDIRCNQGAFSAASRTEVLTVAAGSEVRVRLGYGAKMEHPGPGLVYMSRAPADNVKAYDGSGDWFKIKQEGVCNTSGDFTRDAWCTWGKDYISATIPKDTPSGEYLFRAEHIGVHRSHVNQPEHYTSCVQIKVTNGGTGTPGPMVKFPGAYKATDAYANFSIYNGFKTFPFPGPAVWASGNAGSGTGATPPKVSSTAPPPPSSSAPPPATGTTAPPSANCATKYAQCGGTGFSGVKCCASGSTCTKSNEWYSQCL